MPHTEGPWKVDVLNGDGRVEIVVEGFPGDEDAFVAMCYAKDAPLIAAAPQMYELLKDALKAIEYHGYGDECMFKIQDLLKAVEGTDNA